MREQSPAPYAHTPEVSISTVSSRPSWQQEGRLRRERTRGRWPLNSHFYFELPEGVGPDEARRRIESYAAAQPALRIMTIDEETATYAPELLGTVAEYEVPDLAQAARGFLVERADAMFDRSSGYLWDMAVLTQGHRSAVVAIFDHLISDGYSLRVFRGHLADGGPSRPPAAGSGSLGYLDWVAWQRETYVDSSSSAAAFWREMFDGVPGNRPVHLAESKDPVADLTGVVHIQRVRQTESPEQRRDSSARLGATPFLRWLTALCAAIAESTGMDDVNLGVFVNGRTPANARVHGWVTNDLPFRVRGELLSEPARALRATREVWTAFRSHQTAPRDFVLEHACGTPRVNEPRPLTVSLNYAEQVTTVFAETTPVAEPGHTAPGDEVGIFLTIIPDALGYRLEAVADVARFSAEGLTAFVDRVRRKWAQLESTAPL